MTPVPETASAAYERGWAACEDACRIKLDRLRAENDRLIDENTDLRRAAAVLGSVREALVDWSNEARDDLTALRGQIEDVRAASQRVEVAADEYRARRSPLLGRRKAKKEDGRANA